MQKITIITSIRHPNAGSLTILFLLPYLLDEFIWLLHNSGHTGRLCLLLISTDSSPLGLRCVASLRAGQLFQRDPVTLNLEWSFYDFFVMLGRLLMTDGLVSSWMKYILSFIVINSVKCFGSWFEYSLSKYYFFPFSTIWVRIRDM